MPVWIAQAYVYVPGISKRRLYELGNGSPAPMGLASTGAGSRIPEVQALPSYADPLAAVAML